MREKNTYWGRKGVNLDIEKLPIAATWTNNDFKGDLRHIEKSPGWWSSATTELGVLKRTLARVAWCAEAYAVLEGSVSSRANVGHRSRGDQQKR